MSIQQTRTQQWLTGARAGSAILVALMLLPAMAEAEPPCGGWDPVPTPNVGNSVNRLTSVAALSANDAWAVGLRRDASGVFGPLAMRWNGTAWSQTSLPSTAALGSLPEAAGVETASNGDVWVVGHVYVGYPYDNRPLVLRWRGGSWDYVDVVTLRPSTVYPFAPRGGILYEASALTLMTSGRWAWPAARAMGERRRFLSPSTGTVPTGRRWMFPASRTGTTS